MVNDRLNMDAEEYFPWLKINMFYSKHLEYSCGYFITPRNHVWCPRQIVVNYYSQLSMVLYLFNGDAFYGQWKGGGGGEGNKTLYFAVLSSIY